MIHEDVDEAARSPPRKSLSRDREKHEEMRGDAREEAAADRSNPRGPGL